MILVCLWVLCASGDEEQRLRQLRKEKPSLSQQKRQKSEESIQLVDDEVEMEFERRKRIVENLSRKERTKFEKPVDRILTASSYYSVLGVGRNADTSALKHVYRRAALSVHPDRNPSPRAAAAFDRLTEAHETLSDPQRRRLYNHRLRRKARSARTKMKRQMKAALDDFVALVTYRAKTKPQLFSLGFLLSALLFL